MQFWRFFEDISVKPLVRLLYSTDFERFRLTSSTNIDNSNFAILLISDRSKDTRFHQNYEVQKTLQNQSKIQNVDAFATSKTSKWSISHGFCRLFRLLGFVVKRLCGRLANSVLLCRLITWNMRFSSWIRVFCDKPPGSGSWLACRRAEHAYISAN